MGNTLYSLPDVKSKRGTSLGYGTKYDFTKEQKNKAPYYNHKSDFGKDHPMPSYTFGIARQYYEKVWINLDKLGIFGILKFPR